MSFSIKKILSLALISILLAIPITFTYLNFHGKNASEEIGHELNNTLLCLTSSIFKLQENTTDKNNISALVRLVLSSPALRSVAYIKNGEYIYSDRDISLHKPISNSLRQKIKNNKPPFLYLKRSSLNKINELHLVEKGKYGYYQLFINSLYMDDWLMNASDFYHGYITSLDNKIIINKKQNLIFKKQYQSAVFPFIVTLGVQKSQLLFYISSVAGFIFIISLLLSLIIMRLKNNHFSFKHEIDRAIKNHEFIPFYQPIICNKTNNCIGAELLCRWHHRDNRIISPDQFIKEVESNGQIKIITLQLLKQLSVDKPIISDNNPNFYVSVNFTLTMLSDPYFINAVIELIKNTPSLQSGLVFEITERENTAHTFKKLDTIMDQLRQLGIRWALDDFGTGYSSLSSLKELNFDIIKIDRLFVNTANTDAITGSILNNIASLGQMLNCKMIAEGVETSKQLAKIISLNIDYTQGYYFSKPLASKDFCQFKHDHSKKNHPIKNRHGYLLQYSGPIFKPK